VPWCEPCSKYLSPNTVRSDGSCPTCGEQVGEIEQRAAVQLDETSTPWHFKLLVGALVIYLGWRIVQMISWLL
jgi:hypothetical protein